MFHAAFKIEDRQYVGDDTSANDFRSQCWDSNASGMSSGYLQASNGAQWGNWRNGANCAEKSAICGISCKFEKSQGLGDDTAMNGAFFLCCPL